MEYTILIRYRFDRSWLQLSRAARQDFEETHIQPLFARYSDQVQARFFDAEAFHVEFTDFMLLTTKDLQAYYFLMEEIRDSALVAEGYIHFTDISIGIEDGYKEFAAATEKEH
ncbi:MAG TPA: hypothetical protein DEA26_01720 [Oceanospirillales bacterium]|nr:hypothetical protein [Oceanospirillaceae bacterium]HBS41368.1 hypothetical protein [Oceanospirillales bacterium]|tara:strand:- start:1034 stop:1372 length:339 start_codon:yes stop_codon:yes gene_type:complete